MRRLFELSGRGIVGDGGEHDINGSMLNKPKSRNAHITTMIHGLYVAKGYHCE